MPPRSKASLRRSAFTAIEMLAVIALTVILASMAMLSLVGLQRTSDMHSVVDHLASFDATTRGLARRTGKPMTLTLDTDDSSIARLPLGSDDATVLHLPEGFSIDRVTTPGHAGVSGNIQIPISAGGVSPSYAVLLLGNNRRQWVLVTSIGQTRTVDDETTIDPIFDRLSAR